MLEIANAVWAKPPYEFSASYLSTIKASLGADAKTLTSAAGVNAWVANATHGKIPTIVEEQVCLSLHQALLRKHACKPVFVATTALQLSHACLASHAECCRHGHHVAELEPGCCLTRSPPMDPQALQDAAALVVNALYFKGKWDKEFEPSATFPQPFRLLGAKGEVTVPMMTQTHKRVLHTDTNAPCVAVKIPYKGERRIVSHVCCRMLL